MTSHQHSFLGAISRKGVPPKATAMDARPERSRGGKYISEDWCLPTLDGMVHCLPDEHRLTRRASLLSATEVVEVEAEASLSQ